MPAFFFLDCMRTSDFILVAACPHVAEVLGNGGEPSTKGDFEDSADGEVGSDGGGASRKRNSSFSEAI